MTIYGDGINQGDLKSLYDSIHDNFNNILGKLDNDSGVNDTDYESSNSVIAHGVKDTGRDWEDEYDFLDDFVNKLDSTLTKLDNDSSVNDTNYNSNIALSTDLTSFSIRSNGLDQGNLVYLLDQMLKAINSLNSKLDSDSGVNDTNYASNYDVTDVVDETGTYSS